MRCHLNYGLCLVRVEQIGAAIQTSTIFDDFRIQAFAPLSLVLGMAAPKAKSLTNETSSQGAQIVMVRAMAPVAD